ncbi:MAG: UvrD-helicase domain-containing protein [Clostridia bacterium]|nr:UvrD-helicase domain-containing protein [Clostridia bacterium]
MNSENKPTPSQQVAETLYGRDLLVSASAGSGKTHVLIERIILRLTDQNDPISLSELLVVTFTRNATAELKRRISDALNKALAKNPGDSRLSKELLLLGGAQISTIDAFLQKLVRDHFDLLGIPRGFRIVMDEEELEETAERIMKETLEDLYGVDKKAKKEFFQALAKNEFASSMDHLLNAKHELELRQTLFYLEKKFRHFPEGIEFLKHSADRLEKEKALPYFSTLAGKALKQYTKERFDRFFCILSQHAESIAESDEEPYKVFALKDVEFCQYVKAALERGYEETKVALFLRDMSERFPTIKGHQKSDAALAFQEYRNLFKAGIGYLRTLYSSFQVDIQQEMEKSEKLARTLYTCLLEYNRRFMEEKKARGSFTFDDIAHFAHSLLIGTDGTPTALAKELSERYREVYVDEYQDVNRLQDEIFAAIGKGKRFLVGDIKQSIYAFRGGEPEVFAEYRRNMPLYSDPSSSDATGSSVFMAENFRCDRTIIKTVNQVCAPLFSRASVEMNYRKEDDLVFGKEPVNEHPEPVIVRLFETNPDKEEPDEVSFVADEIKRLMDEERIPAKDIVILVRNNDQALPFAKALRARKIHVNVQGNGESEIPTELIDLLNLLFVIDNPHKDIPLNEFLLSPIGNFTLEEILSIRNASDKEAHSLFDALNLYQEEDELSKKISATLAFLEEQRQLAETLPVDKFLQKLYETEPLEALSGSDIPVYLYDQARKYSASGYTGLYEFLNYFQNFCRDGELPKNLFLSEEDAVQILTIHKSKGEQYKVVFVATLANTFSYKGFDSSILLSKQIGFGSTLYDDATLLSRSTTDYEVVKLFLKEGVREEQIRLLYVAMTRAKERLYLTGTIPGNTKRQTFLSQAKALAEADRHEILAAASPMVWIFAFLTEEEGKPWNRKIYEAGEYVSTFENPQEEADEPSATAPKALPVESRYAKILAEEKTFVNERAILQRLPSKVAASKIAPDLFDRILGEDEKAALETRFDLLHSATSFSGYLAELNKPDATDIGSAMHAFLEFCNFAALATNDLESEINRLVNEGFMQAESAALLRLDSLQKFLKSGLFARILSAKGIRREQQFARMIPMKELTEDPVLKEALGEEKIFVQGSIDLILEEENGKTLVDYKTDRVENGESFADFRARMLASHGSQLKTYAEAMEQIFGKAPASICLYSLPLGETIEFSVEELK